jgi:hypothetical protein
MTRQTTARYARPGRFATAVALIACAACSSDPASPFSTNLAIDPPTGYPIGVDGNCLPNLTDDGSRVCWFTQYTAGTKAPDPLSDGSTDCTCVGGGKR